MRECDIIIAKLFDIQKEEIDVKFDNCLYESEFYVCREQADVDSEHRMVCQGQIHAQEAKIIPAPNTLVMIQDEQGGIIYTSRSDGKINIIIKSS